MFCDSTKKETGDGQCMVYDKYGWKGTWSGENSKSEICVNIVILILENR